jgi:hypothetical protein
MPNVTTDLRDPEAVARGRKLKKRMVLYNTTYRELADFLGLHITTVNKWSHGAHGMTLKCEAAVAYYFNIPRSELVGENNVRYMGSNNPGALIDFGEYRNRIIEKDIKFRVPPDHEYNWMVENQIDVEWMRRHGCFNKHPLGEPAKKQPEPDLFTPWTVQKPAPLVSSVPEPEIIPENLNHANLKEFLRVSERYRAQLGVAWKIKDDGSLAALVEF